MREQRYRAEAGDTLESLLGPTAQERVAEGSVFVDGTRVMDVDFPLRAGAEISVGRARLPELCPVLGRLFDFIVVNKPPLLPTEPDRVGNASVRSALALDLDVDERELHAVSRLDVGVSGVVLFARGAEAKREAARLRDNGEIHRRYIAIAGRVPEPPSGRWETDVDEKRAVTDYVTLARASELALLFLTPLTGRKHQLRIHAKAAGAPLLGDRAHGGALRLVTANGSVIEPPRVALHAWSVSIQKQQIVAPVPADLRQLWRSLGGSESDWELVRDEPVG